MELSTLQLRVLIKDPYYNLLLVRDSTILLATPAAKEEYFEQVLSRHREARTVYLRDSFLPLVRRFSSSQYIIVVSFGAIIVEARF